MNCQRLVVLVSVVVCVATCGCGPKRAARPDRAIVTGTVTYQGKPVPGGVITFTGANGDTEGGMLRENGSFYVENAPVGENKISVDPEQIKPELGSRYVKLPAKYLQAETTDLTFNVEAGSNTADFNLE
jgi:hypothetical protein